MEPVYLESPFAVDVERNVTYARLAIIDSLHRGEAPFASHLLYTQSLILDDLVPVERMLGINAGFAWAKLCKKSVFYIDLGLSNGMKEALEETARHMRILEYRKLPENVMLDHFWRHTAADEWMLQKRVPKEATLFF